MGTFNTAFHTISWGNRFRSREHLEQSLKLIKRAGFNGVEFSQRPDADHLCVPSLAALRELTDPMDLQILGFAGGTLLDRMQFCGSDTTPYLLVYDWNERFIERAIETFTLGLHQRVFSRTSRLRKAEQLLRSHPHLKFVPDTAHLTIAGDDPLKAIKAWGKERLIAVHLKDWNPGSGRSSHQYARGFTMFGEGVVRLEAVLAALEAIEMGSWVDRGRWVVAELDNAYIPPEDALAQCARWLLDPSSRQRRVHSLLTPRRPMTEFDGSPANDRFVVRLAKAAVDADNFYQTVADSVLEVTGAMLVRVWACSPIQSPEPQIALVAASPSRAAALPLIDDNDTGQVFGYGAPLINLSETLSGVAIDRQAAVTQFDLTVSQPASVYGYPERTLQHKSLIEHFAAKAMDSIPVFNSGNQNYVRLMINVFHSTALPAAPPDYDWYSRLSKCVTLTGDYLLDQKVSLTASTVRWLSQESVTASLDITAYLDSLCRIICQAIPCETAAVFQVTESGMTLEAATSGTSWAPNVPRYYTLDQGTTGRVWQENEAFVTADYRKLTHNSQRSWEINPDEDELRGTSRMWVPWCDARGAVAFVVRCANRIGTGATQPRNMFYDDDVAVIDSIGQIAVAQLQLLKNQNNVRLAEMVSHPVLRPLVQIRDLTGRQAGLEECESPRCLCKDELARIHKWSEFTARVFENVSVLTRLITGQNLKPDKKALHVRTDIIAPIVPALELTIRDKEATVQSLDVSSLVDLTVLGDPMLLQLACFNILSNAIIYCDTQRHALDIKVSGVKATDKVVLNFVDHGVGFENELASRVFQEIGARGPKSGFYNVEGHGVGLWLVRHIVAAHGGRVYIRQQRSPTIITIELPSLP